MTTTPSTSPEQPGEGFVTKGAPIDMFLKVAKTLDGDLIVTPELFSKIVGIANQLDEIERPNRLLTEGSRGEKSE